MRGHASLQGYRGASAEEAVRLAPGSHRAQIGLALSLFVAGYGDRARGPLERARASVPEEPLALRLLGEIELRHDPAAAEAIFRSALRADARTGLSRALARQGRAKEAEEAFEAAAGRDPSFAADRDARRRDAARGAATTISLVASGLARPMGHAVKQRGQLMRTGLNVAMADLTRRDSTATGSGERCGGSRHRAGEFPCSPARRVVEPRLYTRLDGKGARAFVTSMSALGPLRDD